MASTDDNVEADLRPSSSAAAMAVVQIIEHDEDYVELRGDLAGILVRMVQANPVLWNQQLNEFRDKEKREATWNDIAINLGLTFEECQTKWRLLRDKYTRELRKSGADDTYQSKWKHMKAMDFLKQHVKPRRTIVGHYLSLSRNTTTTSPHPPAPAVPPPPKDRHILQCGTESSDSILDDDDDELQQNGTGSETMERETRGSPPSLLRTSNEDLLICCCPPNDEGATRLLQSRRRTRTTDAQLCDTLYDMLCDTLASTKNALSELSSQLIRQQQQRGGGKMRRIDALCGLLESKYSSLPVDLQEEFDIEVLTLLRDYGKRSTSTTTAVATET